MKDFINRALLSGLGLASLAKDAIQKTAEDLVDQSKLSEDEGRKLVKDLEKRTRELRKTLEKKVETAVQQALKGLNLEVIKEKPKAAGKKKRATKKRGGRKSGGAGKAGPH